MQVVGGVGNGGVLGTIGWVGLELEGLGNVLWQGGIIVDDWDRDVVRKELTMKGAHGWMSVEMGKRR